MDFFLLSLLQLISRQRFAVEPFFLSFLFFSFAWKVCQIVIAFPVAFARLDKRESLQTANVSVNNKGLTPLFSLLLNISYFVQILQINTIKSMISSNLKK